MHIQIRSYKRAHPQVIADLSALIKYMLEAKEPDEDQRKRNHEARLAGPPVTSRLVQRVSPFGETISLAAYDLAQQLFKHARDRQAEGDLPSVVYKHLLFSLPVDQPLNKRFLAFTQLMAERQPRSEFQIIVRMVKQAMDAMGIEEGAPSLIVVHNDTAHFHAHVVVGMFAADVDCSAAFQTLKPAILRQISSALYAGNRWPQPSLALANEFNETPAPTDSGFRPAL